MWRFNYSHYLCHNGIKGMKWGVRNGPPYPLDRETHDKVVSSVEKTDKPGIIKKTVSGHQSTPKDGTPNSITDHVENGKVDKRTFYGDDGLISLEIHTDDHGNPKHHAYGENGEHAHDYEWDENGKLKNRTTRELTTKERKENGDIL